VYQVMILREMILRGFVGRKIRSKVFVCFVVDDVLWLEFWGCIVVFGEFCSFVVFDFGKNRNKSSQ